MDNMEIYNKVREVPKNAQKPINAGRLKGMTDINPMWRIKTLTEVFGACGLGWYYETTAKWIDPVADSQEIIASVEINLYVKYGEEWSKPIYGVGGAKIASKESKGLYVDDEAYKKATTDAISYACKNIGVGADVYWEKDSDKYIDQGRENFNNSEPSYSKPSTERAPSNKNEQTVALSAKIKAYADEHKMTMAEIARDYKLTNANATAERLQEVYDDLTKADTADSKASTPPSHPSTESEQTSMVDEFAELDEKLPF